MCEPDFLANRPPMDSGGAVATGDDGCDTDDDNIDEEMFAILQKSGIVEGLEIRSDGFDIDELCHGTDFRILNAVTIAENRGRRKLRNRPIYAR